MSTSATFGICQEADAKKKNLKPSSIKILPQLIKAVKTSFGSYNTYLDRKKKIQK